MGTKASWMTALLFASPVFSDVGSVIEGFRSLPGARYDDHRSMPLWSDSLGKFGGTGCHARVLVQGMPIYRCRQRTVNACFRTVAFTVIGKTTDYPSVADSGNQMHRRFCPTWGRRSSARQGHGLI